jgi:hypothetical protein
VSWTATHLRKRQSAIPVTRVTRTDHPARRFALALSDGQSQAGVGDEAGQGDPLVDVVAGKG